MSGGTGGTRAGQSNIVPAGGDRNTPLKGVVPSPPQGPLGSEARRLAREVGRLSPDWRDPERYFEQRHELERGLRLLARRIEAEHG